MKFQFKQLFSNFGNDLIEYQQQSLFDYLTKELAPNIKNERDWDFFDQEAEKHNKYMTDDTYRYILELKKQYAMIDIISNKNINMQQVIKNTELAVQNNQLHKDDDKFLAFHINNKLEKSTKIKEVEKLETYAKLIFDKELRKAAKMNSFLRLVEIERAC